MQSRIAASLKSWLDTDPPPAAETGLRFGYGPSASDLLEDVRAAALHPPQATQAEARQFHVDYNAGVGLDPKFWREAALDFRRGAIRRRIALALTSPVGFGERVFSFWADHFTTTPKSYQAMPLQVSLTDEAIRPHVAGRFVDMLKAVTLHPMMLIYLDQNLSVGDHSVYAAGRTDSGLNENLGRELLELHTVGLDGPYDQNDVRETANLLAGLIYRTGQGTIYDVRRAEPGTETILGVDYPEDSVAEIHRLLDNLAAHPATALHLARKLAVHFVADTPPQSLIDCMAEAYLDSAGDLTAMYEVLTGSIVNRNPVPQKLRQPLEWIIACLRALGVSGADVAALPADLFNRVIVDSLGAMGQPFDQCAGPDGWPEHEDEWLAPNLIAARLVWARSAPEQILAALGRQMPDPASLIARHFPRPCGPMVTWSPRAETIQFGVASVLCAPEFLRR